MTYAEFVATWNGKQLDFDHAYGTQCMDVFEQYNQDVVGAPVVYGNAIDVWTKYDTTKYNRYINTPDFVPLQGDVGCWGLEVGQFGHVDLVDKADRNVFTGFDANWPIPPAGSGNGLCHFQQHNYVGVLGFLRPKVNEPVPVPAPPEPPPAPPSDVITDPQARIDLGDPDGVLELQAVRSKLHDQENVINGFPAQLKTITDKLAQAQIDNQALADRITVLNKQIADTKLETHDPNSIWIKLYNAFYHK